ncbi:MAG: hypothetical protein LBL94_04350 [Prevotellaceae bacterium]|jgi:hypothetical protein|nr:hypothetical protein [Prevotellaceae bacterium]
MAKSYFIYTIQLITHTISVVVNEHVKRLRVVNNNPVTNKHGLTFSPTSCGDELHTRLYLFDAQGRTVFTGNVSALRSGLTMPETPGAYHLVIESKAGRKVAKVAVGQKGNEELKTKN